MRFILRNTLVTLLLLIVVASVAYAAVNWGTPSFGTGPTGFNGTDYVLNLTATTGLGTKVVCLQWSYTDTSSSPQSGSVQCAGSNNNPFTCTLPKSSVANAAPPGISWALTSRTTNCAGTLDSSGPTSVSSQLGNFAPIGTNSNAVALSSFAADRSDAGWQMGAIALLGLLGLGGGWWWARSRRQPVTG